MGAVGSLVLAAIHRRLNWPMLKEAMNGTMRLTAMVVFILIGSRVFSLVFQGVDGAKWIEHMLSGLPGGQIGFLIAVNIFVFFLAFFLDFFEIAFIILPMLGPVAAKLGIDMVWFGVLLCVNMQTSLHASALRLCAVLPARHRRHAVQERRACRARSSRATSTWARFPGSGCSCCWWRS